MYQVEITNLVPFKLLAREHRGSYQSINAAFSDLGAWGHSQGLVKPDARMVGLYFDDPMEKPEDQLRSQACVELATDMNPRDLPDRFSITHSPSGRAARLVFKGPYAELGPVYQWVYSAWLPTTGEKPSEQPAMEEYLNDPRHHQPSDWLTAIYVPLKPT